MNRPRGTVVVLALTLAIVPLSVAATWYSYRTADLGDPSHAAYATSFVHLASSATANAFNLLGAIWLYRLRAPAHLFFTAVLAVQLFDITYGFVTSNAINVDLIIFMTVGFVSYSYRLFNQGFLT